jgi:hypothetical protein
VSKLAERIRKASRTAPQPIGFGAAKAANEPTVVLLGVARDAKDAAELARRGADAVIVEKAGGGAPDGAIAGTWLDGQSDARQLKEAGFDFVAFDADRTPATAVLEEDVGYVIVLPKDATDTDLRALESFGVDAIDIGTIEGALTVRRQIELRRVHALTRKPLLAHVKGDIAPAMLQALRDTNVAVVAAEGADAVERLRKTIDALPPRSRRREEGDRPVPLVPRAAATDEEYEDDD